MGRRSLQPRQARQLTVAAHDMRQTAALCGAIEYEIAQRAMNAIGVIEGLMLDATVPPAVRLDAAREFLDRTVGKPAIRAEIAMPPPQTDDRASREKIAAIRRESAKMLELDACVRRGVPYAEWPDHIKQMPEAADFAELAESELMATA